MGERVTVATLREMKRAGRRIAMLTAYDYPTARLLDEAGVDVLLVGDSLGMVVYGHPTTLPVTLDDVVRHAQAVVRGARRALVVADLPFLTYQVPPEEALRSAGRLLQEAGVHAVKLEGGAALAPTVRRLVEAGIPVMGHVGLTPQSVHVVGGYRLQGQDEAGARRVLADAEAVAAAGAFAVVLEMVPAPLARRITARLPVPTIGIGAGPHCDGQVLVLHDAVGLTQGKVPRFVRRYAEVGAAIRDAAARFVAEVREGLFPGPEHSFPMDEEVLARLDAEAPRGEVRP